MNGTIINMSEIMSVAIVNVPALAIAGWFIIRSIKRHDQSHEKIEYSVRQIEERIASIDQQATLIASNQAHIAKDLGKLEISSSQIDRAVSRSTEALSDIKNIGMKVRKIEIQLGELV